MILVDTDISLGTPCAEIDDGAALIVLLRALGERVTACPLEGVGAVTTVHGNVTANEATQNACRLLSYLDREDIPTGQGAALPLIEDPAWFDGWKKGYGRTPPFPTQRQIHSAAELIIETIRAHPNQVTLLALGPLTNLALAVRLAPDIVGKVREVVMMGGSFGEQNPMAEFNARCDPEAAHIVLTAVWPLRLLGLNITRQVLFSKADFARLPNHPALNLLKQQAPGWIDRVEEQGWETGGCSLHDAVAVAALLDESLFEWRETAVSIELSNPQNRGVMRFDTGKHPGRVATQIDAKQVYNLIWSHLIK
jgi:inosine-uridine nucleoside N-ribohydrolase